MGVISDAAVSKGDHNKQIADLWAAVRQLRHERRLPAASIGSGGLRIQGGLLRVQDEFGNDKFVASIDGVTLERGGLIRAEYEDGVTALLAGTWNISELLKGVQVQAPDGQTAVLFAGRREDGTTNVLMGTSNNLLVDFILSWSDFLALRGVTVAAVKDATDTYGMQAQADNLFLLTDATTTDAANVNLGVTGVLARVTSSAESKVDVEDLTVDMEALLRLRPRTWRDRGEVEREPDTDRWHVGLVAEEVAEAGLHEFVDYDESGRPWSVAYDRLAVGLLELVREQQRRLDDLDGGVARAAPAGRKPRRRATMAVKPVPVPRSAVTPPRAAPPPRTGPAPGTATQ